MVWLSIFFDVSNTCDVWQDWAGQNRETDGEHDNDCVEGMESETGKLLGRGIVVSIFEMDQNWN